MVFILEIMKIKMLVLLIAVASAFSSGCGEGNSIDLDKKVVAVDPSLFFKESLVTEIKEEECVLSEGTKTLCYRIVVKSEPKEHKMGPWCPETVDDTKEKGGIWFRDGTIYDVDGPFIKNLATFYSDSEWKLYRDDGSIKVTKSQEACEAAARPDVAAEYNNYCVECSPSFYKSIETTYLIPSVPVYKTRTTELIRDGIGIAFNGVGFDPPAPVDAILDAHTLAPLDDCGGHVNPHKGYHYHALKGCSKENDQKDNHPPMLGYALDGFGIYALLDNKGNEVEGLDQCRGHTDDKRGYHYHSSKPGDNKIIGCFRGEPGSAVAGAK